MAIGDDETYGWAYAPPSHLEGEPAVPIPAEPPGLEIPANRATRLPSGVVAYRETVGHHNRMQELDRQAQAAKMARDQAAQDARMLDQMMRVARSTKDIEIARRSIDVMGLQRDIQNGVPIHEAVARHPMALGGGFGTALRATAPEPKFSPRAVQVGDVKLFETAPNRFAFPPASSMPAAPGSITQEKRLTVDVLRDQLRDVERAIADNSVFGASPTVKAKIDEWTGQRDELKRKLAELVPGGYSATPQKPVAVLGQGTRSDPARPTSKEQFNSLPSGAFFINPSDGKLRQKK